MTSDSVSCNKN